MENYFICLFCFIFCMAACQQPEVLEPGVSRELAMQRKSEINDLRYQLHFCIPEEKTKDVAGKVVIFFKLDSLNRIVLDFRQDTMQVKKMQVNGKKLKAQIKNEHIVIPEEYLRKGQNEVEIEFIAGNQSLNRNEDYLYTLLVPDRARTLFPCFDQPDLKAVFTLELDIPGHWVAVANGPVKEQKTEAGRCYMTFESTRPISTYLFSFVAGRWEKVTETRNRHTISLYHRETDSVKLKQTGVIFDQVFAALQWMEEYTGIPYPFSKYDLVAVPGFQFGGMEHPGAVLYNDKQVFLSEHPTIEEELKRMELISHETTHMWFGDDVTMVWFDDVWTKEVFANYFAARMTEPQFPQVNHRLNALRSFYPAAYSEDRTAGSTSIKQTLDNLQEAGLIYGQIVYNKAPVVMKMLVELMGEEAFQKGIREYLHTYAYSNAAWEDLISILDQYTPLDLRKWSHIWVNEKGMPEIVMDWKDNQLIIQQNDPWKRGIFWPQKINSLLVKSIEKDKAGEQKILAVSVPEQNEQMMCQAIDTIHILKEADYVLPNVDGNAYGYFVLDQEIASYCLEHLCDFSDPVTRLSLIITLNENRLRHRLSSDEFTQALLKHLETEQEPLIVSIVVGYIKDACLRKQMGRNPATEQALLELSRKERNSGCQRVAFRALLDVWTLPEITEELFRIWKTRELYPGLILNERDNIKMAYELGIRMSGQAEEIIAEQSRRISNPDRQREFNFVAQAITSDTLKCDSLFYSLFIPANRRIEPWVEQIMYYLNHPLREKQSVKYILPALENLQDIQRTGDIFFPKNWISSCLRGHNSPDAARVVRQFLQDHPDYPLLLKNKILQSADHLYR